METQAKQSGFEVFETPYKLYKHGYTFPMVVKYEYNQATKVLEVLGVTPSMELTQKDMEEIDLHCWSDRVRHETLEFLEEEVYTLLGCLPTGEVRCA
jgi:hypothetical protein